MHTDDQPTPEDDPVLREALKRCSPATYYAACKFRATGTAGDLQLVVLGVIERFVERDHRAKLQAGDDSLRLREDLGLDSLTMMEVIMLVEEVVPIAISNAELTHLQTVGDTRRFIAGKHAERDSARPVTVVRPPATRWQSGALESHLRGLDAETPVPPAA